MDKEITEKVVDNEKSVLDTWSVTDFCKTISEPIEIIKKTQEIKKESTNATTLKQSRALNKIFCLYLKTITGSDKPEAEGIKQQVRSCIRRYMEKSPDYNKAEEVETAVLKEMEVLCNQTETLGFSNSKNKTVLLYQSALKNINGLAGIMLSTSDPNVDDFLRETLSQERLTAVMEEVVQSISSGSEGHQSSARSKCKVIINFAEEMLRVSKQEQRQESARK